MEKFNPFSAGLTRETKLPKSDVERGRIFRFERGQILRAYKNLRETIRLKHGYGVEADEEKELLKKFREKAKIIEKDLDELNRQFYESRRVEVETPETGRHILPVTVLDLNKEGGKEDDARTPYLFLGSFMSNPHQTAALTTALALSGERVYTPTYPEQEYAETPDDWAGRLAKDGTFKLHAALVKNLVKKLGLKKINILGSSFGGGLALELAQDEEFTREHLENLTVMEPMGLGEKSTPKLAFDFMVKEAGATMMSAEGREKAFSQGQETVKVKKGMLGPIVNILKKKQFDTEKLAKIKPSGRYQVWMGEKSPLLKADEAGGIFLEADKERISNNSTAKKVELYKIKGGRHSFPFIYSMGVVQKMKENSERQITEIAAQELDNSTAKFILRNV